MKLLPQSFIAAVNELNSIQSTDGSVQPIASLTHEKSTQLVSVIQFNAISIAESLDQYHYAEALRTDFDRWIAAGLDSQPNFTTSRDALRPPTEGSLFFFVGPLRLANGQRKGWKFETFLTLREEPGSKAYLNLYDMFPHPKNICQSTHLLSGSNGLIRGNNIVFFPENIQASNPVTNQAYAIFFFNKFYDIFNEITIEYTDRVCHDVLISNPTQHSRRETYLARCVWGYLHDYFHHQGVRPFDEQIQIKTKWFTGLLEELKVDLQTYLACIENNFINADSVAEFILLDRAFRYPSESDWYRNFDSGTGLLLLAFLHESGAIKVKDDGLLLLNFNEIARAARQFISDVNRIELLEDEVYLTEAKKMVRRYLPEGPSGERIGIPRCFCKSKVAEIVGISSSALAFTEHNLQASYS